MSPQTGHVSKRLYHFDEMPSWRRDNGLLRSGYRQVVGGFGVIMTLTQGDRPVSYSIFTSLRSLL